jgi:hypothetical protein
LRTFLEYLGWLLLLEVSAILVFLAKNKSTADWLKSIKKIEQHFAGHGIYVTRSRTEEKPKG